MLRLQHLSIVRGTRTLYDNVNLVASDGERIALVAGSVWIRRLFYDAEVLGGQHLDAGGYGRVRRGLGTGLRRLFLRHPSGASLCEWYRGHRRGSQRVRRYDGDGRLP